MVEGLSIVPKPDQQIVPTQPREVIDFNSGASSFEGNTPETLQEVSRSSEPVIQMETGYQVIPADGLKPEGGDIVSRTLSPTVYSTESLAGSTQGKMIQSQREQLDRILSTDSLDAKQKQEKGNAILKSLNRYLPAGKTYKSLNQYMRMRPIELKLLNRKTTDIRTTDIGKMVLTRLKKIDSLGYILFSSVYNEFDNLEELEKAIEEVNED